MPPTDKECPKSGLQNVLAQEASEPVALASPPTPFLFLPYGLVLLSEANLVLFIELSPVSVLDC